MKNSKIHSNSTDIRQIRKFGIVAFPFFGIIATILFLRGRVYIPSFLSALSLLALGFILLPRHLKYFYLTWIGISHIIGRGITGLSMLIAYLFIITPFAIIRRIFGSPIPLKPDSSVDTYWVSREEPYQPKDRFLKRY